MVQKEKKYCRELDVQQTMNVLKDPDAADRVNFVVLSQDADKRIHADLYSLLNIDSVSGQLYVTEHMSEQMIQDVIAYGHADYVADFLKSVGEHDDDQSCMVLNAYKNADGDFIHFNSAPVIWFSAFAPMSDEEIRNWDLTKYCDRLHVRIDALNSHLDHYRQNANAEYRRNRIAFDLKPIKLAYAEKGSDDANIVAEVGRLTGRYPDENGEYTDGFVFSPMWAADNMRIRKYMLELVSPWVYEYRKKGEKKVSHSMIIGPEQAARYISNSVQNEDGMYVMNAKVVDMSARKYTKDGVEIMQLYGSAKPDIMMEWSRHMYGEPAAASAMTLYDHVYLRETQAKQHSGFAQEVIYVPKQFGALLMDDAPIEPFNQAAHDKYVKASVKLHHAKLRKRGLEGPYQAHGEFQNADELADDVFNYGE